MTQAIRALRAAQVPFVGHLYDYVPRGGTSASARALKVDEHCVIKTLVLQDERQRPLLCLMHGDREVSTKNLARHVGVKTIVPCAPEVADRHSGYQVGGTSPFGTRKKMPVYLERTILALPEVYINGGKRGFLVQMAPTDVQSVLGASPVEAAA